ncbi:MAG: hypothetical protein ACP5D2_01785 [Candidatus Nanoarchaeia archaeon]
MMAYNDNSRIFLVGEEGTACVVNMSPEDWVFAGREPEGLYSSYKLKLDEEGTKCQ